MSKLSFTAHPDEVGESYVEHLGVATSFGFSMIAGGLACLLHGIFPFLFTKTGSRIIAHLHDRMVAHRGKAAMSR